METHLDSHTLPLSSIHTMPAGLLPECLTDCLMHGSKGHRCIRDATNAENAPWTE